MTTRVRRFTIVCFTKMRGWVDDVEFERCRVAVSDVAAIRKATPAPIYRMSRVDECDVPAILDGHLVECSHDIRVISFGIQCDRHVEGIAKSSFDAKLAGDTDL